MTQQVINIGTGPNTGTGDPARTAFTKTNSNFTELYGTTGAASVGYTGSGTGAVSRTTAAKLGDFVNVKDFGAVGDGAADDTAAIQATINYVSILNGGQIYLPAGTYKISSTLTVTSSNVLLVGSGGDSSHDVGTQGAGTKIVWAGTSGGTMMQFASPSGASNQAKTGGGVFGVFFQCASSAAIGLQILSWRMAEFRDLCFINPTVAAIDMNVVASLGEARDPQSNEFSQISVRCVDGGGATGSFVRLDGDATANTSMNVFEQIDGSYASGSAFLLKNCDNNLFIRCRAYRATGSGASVEFRGSSSSASEAARTNIFVHFSSNAAAVAKGTSSYTYASSSNTMLLLDQDNSTPDPTIETGASLHYTLTNNVDVAPGITKAVVGNTAADVVSAKARITSNESMRIYNASSDHVRLDDGTNIWSISIASNNLRLLRVAGSGYYSLSLDAIGNYVDDAAAAAGGVPVWGVYRTGSIIKIRAA